MKSSKESKESKEPAPPTAEELRRAWLRAAFLGPLLLILVGGALVLCGGSGSVTDRLGTSLRSVILAPLAALVYGGILVVVDVILAVIRLRRRPVGIGAWASSAGALVVGSLVTLLIKAVLEGMVSQQAFSGIVLGGAFASALAVRLLFGSPPEPKAKPAP